MDGLDSTGDTLIIPLCDSNDILNKWLQSVPKFSLFSTLDTKVITTRLKLDLTH
jgi:hypothetical protein